MDIGANTESSFASSANDYHSRLGTLINLFDSFGQLIKHISINCIQFLGTVKLDVSNMPMVTNSDSIQDT